MRPKPSSPKEDSWDCPASISLPDAKMKARFGPEKQGFGPGVWFRVLGFGPGLWFRVLGFRVLGFRV